MSPAPVPPHHARLSVDTAAIVANWRRFQRAGSPAECGAALKADAYGLGATDVAKALIGAGCRDIFVAHWHELLALGRWPETVRVAVLHGVADADMDFARSSAAVPVLVTPAQVAAWRQTGLPCDVMVDTGMNRLGLDIAEARSGLLDGLNLHTVHSHLAVSENPAHPLNERQRLAFSTLVGQVPAKRFALASSAGIGMGAGYHFGLTRPGIGLFGGGPAPDGGSLAPVVRLEARVIQCRDVAVGDSVSYGATFVATRPTRLAIVSLGYADGYPRSLSNRGAALVDGVRCPVAGRVTMDLTAFDVTDVPSLHENDWLTIEFDLLTTAAAAGRTEYELLTGLGARYARVYT